MAEILGRVFGRKVRLLHVPMWMFVRAMRVSGWSKFARLSVRAYVREHRRGAFEVNAPTDHVSIVGGREPESFETTVRRYAGLAQLAPTFANRIRTIADFGRIGIEPSSNLEAYAMNADLPVPPSPRSTLDDERWLIERDPQWPRLAAY